MINADQINTILGIDESYKAPTAIMKLLFDKDGWIRRIENDETV